MPYWVGRWELKPLFIQAKFERLFAALRYHCDFFLDVHVVDSASSLDLAPRLASSSHVIAADNELRIAVYHEVRVVTGKYELPTVLGFPNLPHDVCAHLTVDIVFRLINDERRALLVQQHREECGCLLTSRCIDERHVFICFLVGAILKNRIELRLGDRRLKPFRRVETRNEPASFAFDEATSSHDRCNWQRFRSHCAMECQLLQF